MNLIFIKPSTEIVKFIAPVSGVLAQVRGLYDYIVKMYLVLKNPLLFIQGKGR